MKCLLKYQWVKLSRAYLPQGKGLMGYWAKLASRAAFRKGHALYCGYKNEVIPGMWSGGIVGLKSILGLKSRAQALEIMNELSALGYISYSLDPKTKKLTYQINDWVVKCSGAECSEGTVYASDGYGFICLPRDITQRLADSNRKFSESDAWLDLWCHTVWQDSGNIFSLLAPTVQFERRKALLTLETMGQRWKWEKTKVWRFFQKYKDVFALYRLPGSYGCLIFNQLYQTGTEVSLPTQANVVRIIEEIRISAANVHIEGTDHVCKNYPECDAYVRVHTGTTIPVGSLANHELRTLRRTAHQYFDQLYLSGMMSKQDAYQWLADLLSAPLSKAHIGYLGEYYCKVVIEESRKMLQKRGNKKVPKFEVIQGGAAS